MDINWWTVILSIMLSLITVRIETSRLIDKIIEEEERFLDEVRNITIKAVKERL